MLAGAGVMALLVLSMPLAPWVVGLLAALALTAFGPAVGGCAQKLRRALPTGSALDALPKDTREKLLREVRVVEECTRWGYVGAGFGGFLGVLGLCLVGVIG
jgi:hypothetical protein